MSCPSPQFDNPRRDPKPRNRFRPLLPASLLLRWTLFPFAVVGILVLLTWMRESLGGVTPVSGAAHMRSLKACGSLTKEGETYVLESDVLSAGTCFSVEADHITLNLNSHSITYAADPKGVARFGISGIACWDPDLRPSQRAQGNPCSEHSSNFTVFGGAINQAPGAAPYSHAIRIGQTNDGDHLTVHDLVISVSSPSSIPIYTNFAGADSQIYNNTFKNSVTKIYDRHQEEGQSIKFNNTGKTSPGQRIFGNSVVGGPQGGILTESPGSIIHDNTIAMDGRYSNDFAINLWGSHQLAYHNKVDVKSGRGIIIDGSATTTIGVSAYENDITVIELKQNEEYDGCELGGAIGIQFDDQGGGTVYKNKVLAKADDCPAVGLRLTRVGDHSNSHDNFYTTERIGQTSTVALGFSTGTAADFSSFNDRFTADTYNVAFDWDGGKNLTFQNDTFVKGDNPAPNYATFSFRNGGKTAVQGIRFIDCKFLGGASKDATDMQAINDKNWPGPSEYFIEWTLTFRVTNEKGSAIRGASVMIADLQQVQVAKGLTDAHGVFSAVLTEFRRFNTVAGVTKELHTPHTVQISRDGCSPSSFSVAIESPIERSLVLRCAN